MGSSELWVFITFVFNIIYLLLSLYNLIFDDGHI